MNITHRVKVVNTDKHGKIPFRFSKNDGFKVDGIKVEPGYLVKKKYTGYINLDSLFIA